MTAFAPQLRSPAAVLACWEAGYTAPEISGGIAALSALGTQPADALLDAPISRVAALALEAFTVLFGTAQADLVDLVMDCEQCGQQLEFELSLQGLLQQNSGTLPEALQVDGRITVRAPTARDLLAMEAGDDVVAALVERCALRDGNPVAWETWTDAARANIDEALETLAGAALSPIAATCPACQGPVEAVLDPTALLWQGIAHAAPQLLCQVATLATAFGWSEGDVLALSPERRAAYLALVDA